MNKQAEKSGLKLLLQPLEFHILKRAANNSFEEVTDFGSHSLMRSFKLNATDVIKAKATGVVFLPDSDTFRPVPTLFTTQDDGSVTAELKRNGNSIYTIVQSDMAFKDATAAWAKDDVARAAAKLLLAGETKDTFGVNSSITRAEFTSMIVKGLGILPKTGDAPFSDVAKRSQYAGDIAAAKHLGLIKGKTATTFDPNGTISRQDIAVILTNVLQYARQSTTSHAASLKPFRDSGAIASYAKSAVALMVEKGLMIGTSSATFDPKADLTRAQAAVVVIRMLEALSLD